MNSKSKFLIKLTSWIKFFSPFNNRNLQTEINLIERYFDDKRLLIFNSNYHQLLSNKSYDNPFTYWGINFKDEKVHSIKFYAHVLDEISTEEISNFIPTTADFSNFLPLRSKETDGELNHVGTALELKFFVERDMSRTGFFFMVNDFGKSELDLSSALDFPEKITKQCIAKGINFEYENNKSFRKNYFYFNASDCQHFFEGKFAILIPNRTDLMEYSQSDSYSKINIFSIKTLRVDKGINWFSKKEKKLIRYFNRKYNLVNLEFGIYENKEVKSIYFFEKKKSKMPTTANMFENILRKPKQSH